MSSFLGFKYATPLTIQNVEQISRSDTANLRIQTVASTAQRWELTVTLEAVNNKEKAKLGRDLAVHQFIHGLTRPFSMTMPQMLGVPEVEGSFTLIKDAASSNIRISSTSSTNILIPKGRFFSLGVLKKVYVVVEDIMVGRSTPNIKMFPKLLAQTSIAFRQSVNFTPNIHVINKESAKQSITYSDGILTKTTMEVTEFLVN